MMDELELLKKDWQKKDEQLPKLSYNEIYTMIWKKSSSIVKWILIISILEFTLPHLLYLLPSTRQNLSLYTDSDFSIYLVSLSVIQYAVILYFIYQFYKRYKEISVLDDAKRLMTKIIKTRKTVKHYVIFSLSMILITCVLMAIGIHLNEEFLTNFPRADEIEGMSVEKLKTALTIGIIIMGFVMVLVMGAIYFFLYGRLIRKLKKNFTELKKLEV
jgi:uncharacterized membrane protein SpoIIM required for sporulation